MRERESLSARIFGPQESFCTIHAVHFSPFDQSRFIGRHWRRSVVTQEVFQAAATYLRQCSYKSGFFTLIFFRRHAAHFSISRSIGYERFFPRGIAPKGKSILTHLQKQAVSDCRTPKLLTRQIFMNITTCIDLKELDCSVISAVFESALPYCCELHEASLANIATGRPASNSPSHTL